MNADELQRQLDEYQKWRIALVKCWTFDAEENPNSLSEHSCCRRGCWGQGSKKRRALLEFWLKRCFRVLQAEVSKPRVALTRRLYDTVAVMSSVMSHSGL